MSTVRDLVSRIRTDLHLTSSDNSITDRAIAYELQSVNIKYILQKMNRRESWPSSNLFTMESCIEMEPADLQSCAGWAPPATISRSKRPIATIVEGKYNLICQGVWSIDKSVRFDESSVNRYINYLRLGMKKKQKFFWVSDGHLYVSLPEIEAVAGAFFYQDFIPDNNMSGGSICGCGEADCPQNPMDMPFRTIQGLEEDIVLATIQKLAAVYKRTTDDKTENDLDESR